LGYFVLQLLQFGRVHGILLFLVLGEHVLELLDLGVVAVSVFLDFGFD